MTKPLDPPNGPSDPESGSSSGGDAQNDGPEIKQVDLTPGNPVSFEVPPNTNLVVNVVGRQGGGCLSSIFSGCGCLATGFIALLVILAMIGSLTR